MSSERIKEESGINVEWLTAIISFTLLMAGLTLDHVISQQWFHGVFRFSWYAVAYLPVGLPVVERVAIRNSR
jgi:hypothetical protein